MILDAILLTVAEISADGEDKSPVAIFPDMRIATDDGVSIVNPKTKFQVWLTGNVDYGMCTYARESQRGEDRPTRRMLYCTNQSSQPEC
jgi:hypothetical protein